MGCWDEKQCERRRARINFLLNVTVQWHFYFFDKFILTHVIPLATPRTFHMCMGSYFEMECWLGKGEKHSRVHNVATTPSHSWSSKKGEVILNRVIHYKKL